MTAAIVIGYGSIGRRHARLLTEMGLSVSVLSRRPVADVRCIGSLADCTADYVVIADETARHGDSLLALAASGFTGPVLVEKPLLVAPAKIALPQSLSVSVGYDLRFHPLLSCLRQFLAGRRVLSAALHVGQHLSGWRPGRDWRQGYSASAALGGGALRDLSHELDYLLWLFGPWKRLAARGGNFAALGIDSDELWALMVECERCPVATIGLSYLDRPARREIHVTTDAGSAHLDFLAGTLATVDGSLSKVVVADELYRAEHECALAGGGSPLCSYDEGLAVVDMIAAAERAAAQSVWVAA